MQSVHQSRKRGRKERARDDRGGGRRSGKTFHLGGVTEADRQKRYLLFATRLRTLFAEFGEEAEARDGRPGEDDGVLARDVLAQLLGHEAVELRLVLQGGQTVCALALLQMD